MAHTPAAPETAPDAPSGSGKNRPTPTRAEQEAARKRPLVADTKEAKARAKMEIAAQREKARIGMANGDDKYLPLRDKGPQRRFVRDFVDAGWHLGEALMPLMIVVILMTLLPQAWVYYGFVGLWMFILFVVADMVITGNRVKRAAKAKFGETHLEKGLAWYGAMRTVQMRFMRLPKPQVARGQYPA